MTDVAKGAGSPAGNSQLTAVAGKVKAEAASKFAGATPLDRDRRSTAGGGLSEYTRKRLATQLRTMYDAVAQQPVPDRFAELIARLDSGDRGET